jgi:O-antigen/teichoic acid export membrane protein
LYFWGKADFNFLIVIIGMEAFFINLTSIYKAGLRALGLFNKMATAIIIYIIISRSLAIFLALINLGLMGVVSGFLIGSIFGTISTILFVRGNFIETETKFSVNPLIKFSYPLFLSSLASIITTQVDVVVIASLTSSYELVGVYSIAVKSLLALNIVWQPIMITIFPLISSKSGLDQPQNITNVIKTTSRYLAYTTIPSCLILVIISPSILEVFYGSQYVTGATALAILAISTILFSFINLLITILTAIGKTNYVLRLNLLTALSSIILLFGLVPLFDINGAAFARIIAYTISLFVSFYYVNKFQKIKFDIGAILKALIASLMILPFLQLFEYILKGVSVYYILIIELLIAALIYLGSLYTLKALNKKDFDLLRQSFPTIFSRLIDILQKIMQRE